MTIDPRAARPSEKSQIKDTIDAERAARRKLTPQERESIVRFMQTMGVAAQDQE